MEASGTAAWPGSGPRIESESPCVRSSEFRGVNKKNRRWPELGAGDNEGRHSDSKGGKTIWVHWGMTKRGDQSGIEAGKGHPLMSDGRHT